MYISVTRWHCYALPRVNMYVFWGWMVSSDRAVQKNVWLSSWVLSVSLLGDALLYIVLPINADAFGISIATVGFLLAVNRIIRTFTYNLVVNFGQAVGPKKLAIIAACAAVVSTFGYAIFESVFLLSLSRIIWGLSYAGLLIVKLHFASLSMSYFMIESVLFLITSHNINNVLSQIS